MNDNKKSKVKSIFKEYFPYVLVVLIVILIKQFIIAPIRVNGDSMNKTLIDDDIMFLNRINYRFSDIKRFDIVVVDIKDEFIIKRVIGLPGEEITYQDNKLYVDGRLVKESYGLGETKDFTMDVPKGSYLVLGDNRENSMDSRYLGFFKKEEILGKAHLVIFPFNRFGVKK